MPPKTNDPPEGSGRPTSDFSSFCEGDIEPTLNKKIETLIDVTRNYIVYLDDEHFVEWSLHESPSGFDNVANKIGHLETLSITQLSPSQRRPFARLLGEAMARILGGGEEKEANEVLDKADSYLDARGSENARRWYLQGVFLVSLAALATAAI